MLPQAEIIQHNEQFVKDFIIFLSRINLMQLFDSAGEKSNV